MKVIAPDDIRALLEQEANLQMMGCDDDSCLAEIGGALGVSLGVGGAWLAATLFDMPVVVSLGAVLLAFVFAAAVGVFFGFYPARKAAGLPPAEALRAV